MKEYRKVAGNTRSAVPAFLLGSGPERQWHTLIDSYCDNPKCIGSEGIIRLIPERSGDSILSFDVDFIELKVIWETDPGERAKALAQGFLDEHSNLLVRRRQVVRAWSLLKAGGRRNYVQGQVYSFRDFQMRNEPFMVPFAHEGRAWDAVDFYCVNPDCSCAYAWLQLLPTWKGENPLRPAFAARLDLKTGSLQREDEKPLTSEEAGVLAAFQESLGDWCGELSLRRNLIRRVARKRLLFTLPEAALDASTLPDLPAPVPAPLLDCPLEPIPAAKPQATTAPAPAPIRSSAQPGRNDPCPCGSGRKYKHCCSR